jgi:hypothetical protein
VILPLLQPEDAAEIQRAEYANAHPARPDIKKAKLFLFMPIETTAFFSFMPVDFRFALLLNASHDATSFVDGCPEFYRLKMDSANGFVKHRNNDYIDFLTRRGFLNAFSLYNIGDVLPAPDNRVP